MSKEINIGELITGYVNQFFRYCEKLGKATADTFAWISIVILLCAPVPNLLAVMASSSDKMPPLDIALMLWFGLLFYFVRSAIIKDMLTVITIGFGFAVQAILLGIIFFQ